jgi:hypothetical protein
MATVKCGPCLHGLRAQRAGCTALLLAGSLLCPAAWAEPPADDADARPGEASHAPMICEQLRAPGTERCRPVARLGADARPLELGTPEREREREGVERRRR